MRAVYLLLIGDPIYAQWAVNLAASVKFYSPDMQVVLLHEAQKNKSIMEVEIFDEFIEIDSKYCWNKNKLTPGIAKLNMYQYFKHEENLYIDCDSLVTKDINGLFDLCKDKDVASEVVGVFNQDSESWPCIWAELNDVRRYYELTDLYNIYELNSSFIYSKKNKEAKSFFSQAVKNIVPDYIGKWGSSFPDELAFNVAFAQTGINPQLPTLQVSHDSKINNTVCGLNELMNNYFLLTFWGGKNLSLISHYKNYDLLAGKIHSYIFGKQNPYKCIDMMRKKYVQTSRGPIIKDVRLPNKVKKVRKKVED